MKDEQGKAFIESAYNYLYRLNGCFTEEVLESVMVLAKELYEAWVDRRQVYICGNGGSSANALHIANDFHYGIGNSGSNYQLPGIRVEALSSNTGIITCLANDIGYENIYSHQLEVKANSDDLLIVLSGSGNSNNVVNAIVTANKLKMKSFAILAFDGGRCLEIAHQSIHISVKDMQIAEDSQLIVGHMCMQWLSINNPNKVKTKSND